MKLPKRPKQRIDELQSNLIRQYVHVQKVELNDVGLEIMLAARTEAIELYLEETYDPPKIVSLQ